MERDDNDIEPISPREARELFLADKATYCADATVYEYRCRTKPYIGWCEEQGIDNVNDLTGRHLHQFRKSRQEDGFKNITLKSQTGSIRVFLKWAQSIEAVPDGLYERVVVPDVSSERPDKNGVPNREGLFGTMSPKKSARRSCQCGN